MSICIWTRIIHNVPSLVSRVERLCSDNNANEISKTFNTAQYNRYHKVQFNFCDHHPCKKMVYIWWHLMPTSAHGRNKNKKHWMNNRKVTDWRTIYMQNYKDFGCKNDTDCESEPHHLMVPIVVRGDLVVWLDLHGSIRWVRFSYRFVISRNQNLD